jgi:hypothetical protein
MAQYRVIKKSYIHDRLYEPGEVVEYDGPAGSGLEPIGNEKRAPEPSRITGMPGPDPGSPPPQSQGKSEYDEGGPNRQTAIREYDEKRLADQENDQVPSTEPQALARADEAAGKHQTDAEDPKIQARNEAITGPLPGDVPVPATDEGPKRKSSKAHAEKPAEE